MSAMKPITISDPEILKLVHEHQVASKSKTASGVAGKLILDGDRFRRFYGLHGGAAAIPPDLRPQPDDEADAA